MKKQKKTSFNLFLWLNLQYRKAYNKVYYRLNRRKLIEHYKNKIDKEALDRDIKTAIKKKQRDKFLKR